MSAPNITVVFGASGPAYDLTQAVQDVLAERRRQVEECGYTVEHDDLWDALAWSDILGDQWSSVNVRLRNDGLHDATRDKLTVLAAVALAAIEAIDRRTQKEKGNG